MVMDGVGESKGAIWGWREQGRDQGSLFRLLAPLTGGQRCSLLGQGAGQRFSFGGRWGGSGERRPQTQPVHCL